MKPPIASDRDRCDIAWRRAQWVTYQGRVDALRLVYSDGSQGPSRRWCGASPKNGSKTNMVASRGWAACGQWLGAKVPLAHWQTCAFIAALRHARVEARWLLDEPVNDDCFLASVESGLAPRLTPRRIVIRDNFGSHEAKAVRLAIRAAGAALLFVAKFTPDLKPIEQPFAKLKPWRRDAADRTRDADSRAIAEVLDSISPTACANDLVNGGYARTQSDPTLAGPWRGAAMAPPAQADRGPKSSASLAAMAT